MSERSGRRETGEETAETDDSRRRVEALQAQVELLSAENRRLRAEYDRTRKQDYRRTAIGFLGLGLLAGVGAVLFPASRDVFVALAGTGLFVAVLVYYLTPERFVPASVGEGVYDAYDRSAEALIADLGLQETTIYVPVGVDDVRAFVPQHTAYEVPGDGALERAVVLTGGERTRGLSLYPTGAALFEEFERSVNGEPPEDPAALADQLADALVGVFELVDAATAEVDPDGGRCSVGIVGSVYARVDGFDHPVGSLIASGIARQLGVPVELDVETPDDGRVDHLVTCSWDPERADTGVEDAG